MKDIEGVWKSRDTEVFEVGCIATGGERKDTERLEEIQRFEDTGKDTELDTKIQR